MTQILESLQVPGTVIAFIVFVVVLFLFSKYIQPSINLNNTAQSGARYAKISDDLVHKVDPDLDIDRFNELCYETYLKIQEAWQNFDYETLRKYTTDELFNMYNMQLATLSAKGGKNIMKDFSLIDIYIHDISIENGFERVSVILKTRFIDYVVDSSNKVIRGSDKYTSEVTYKLDFVKTINDEYNNVCPSCGANLENKASSVCKYCRKIIVSDNYTWVMSKKENINQRRN